MSLKRKMDKFFNKIQWKFIIPLFASSRRKKLKTTRFTVISNNCWGGRLYEYFNIQKQTPTVGLYFYASEYVKFCSRLRYYLSLPLSFINIDDSRHKEDLLRKNEQDAIIGKLDDVEIVFLHYYDKNIILQKWNRRLKRINWDNIILKFSYQNDCSEELIKTFFSIEQYKKICFVGEKIDSCPDALVYPRHAGKETVDETENFDRYFNIIELVNSCL